MRHSGSTYKWLIVLALLVVPRSGYAQHPLAGPQQGGKFVAGRVLVKFRSGVTESQVHGVLGAHMGWSQKVLDGIGVHVVSLATGVREEATVEALKALPEVEFADLDYLRHVSSVTPNDPSFGSQVGLHATNAPNAWSVTTGSSSITIALIDTGVEGTHPDLVANLVPGWNFENNTSNTSDTYYHGTYSAGTVAAVTNNGVGVAGVCWNCKIMALKVSDAATAADSTVASAIVYAQNLGIRIALVGYPVTGSATVDSAAQQFVAAGGIVIVPAGNDGLALTTPNDPNVLTVNSIDSLNNLFSWSNSGPLIDLTAPGSSYTTAPGASYATQWGTSLSAAYVAGVAALVKAANPTCTGQAISNILKQSADDLGTTGWDSSFGWGRVDAARAVGMATTCTSKANTTTSLASSLNPSTWSQTVTFTAAVSPSTATGTVTFSDGTTTLGSGTLSSGRATFSASTLSTGTHSITASYGGDTSNNSSISSALTQTVNTSTKTNTTTSVASSLNPSTWGQTVTFTASVSPSTATGTVTFLDGTTKLGSGTLSSGRVTFSTSTLSTGTHSITASYGGDTSNNSSISSALTQTVNSAGDFSLAASQTNVSVKAGSTVQFTVTVTGSGGFNGTVTFSMASSPSGLTGSFSPSTLTGSGSTTVSVPTAGVAKGNYTLTITATSGSLVRSTAMSLKVHN